MAGGHEAQKSLFFDCIFIMMAGTIKYFIKSPFLEKILYLYIAVLPMDLGNKFLLFNRRVQYSDLLFIFLFIFWLVHSIKKKINSCGKNKKIFYSTQITIAFFLFAVSCSFINSINLIHSLIEWLGLLYVIILFVLIVDIIDCIDKLKKILIVYTLASFISAVVGLGAFLHYVITRNLHGNNFLFFYPIESSLIFFPRIKSFFYTPNMFASFEHIGLIAIICLFFLLKRGKNIKILILLTFVSVSFILLCILLAGSQTLCGVLLTILMILFLFKGKIISVFRYVLFSFTVVVIIFGLCATIWMIYPVKICNDYRKRLVNVEINYAYSHHIIPSMYALSMFKKHPFFGVGLGTFQDQYPKYIDMSIEEISSVRMGVPLDSVLDPHNTYTGALAEWGFLGFFALVILFSGFIMMVIRCGNFKYGLLSNPLHFSLLAGFIGFIFNGLFVDIIMMRHFWILMAVIFIAVKLDSISLIERSRA